MTSRVLTHLLLAVFLVFSTSAMAYCDINDLISEQPLAAASSDWSAYADTHDDKHAHHCHTHFVGDVFSVAFSMVALQPGEREIDPKSVLYRLSYPPLNPPPNA